MFPYIPTQVPHKVISSHIDLIKEILYRLHPIVLSPGLDVIYGLGTRCENIMLQNIDKIINPILRHCQVHQRDFI